MMEEQFWAWFAGFWEGEGSLTASKNKRWVALNITQKNPAPLKFIKEKLGIGNIYVSNGYSYLSIAKRQKLIPIIENMLPYLIFRQDEVNRKLATIKQIVENSNHWTISEEKILKKNVGLKRSELVKLLPKRSASQISMKKQYLREQVKYG